MARRPVKAPQDRGQEALMRELAYYDPGSLFRLDGVKEYNPSELVGRQGLRLFDEMLRDDQIKAAYSFKRYAVLSAGWQIESPPGKPEDWPLSEFVRRRLADIDCTIERVLHGVLSAMAYGFSVSELVYRVIEQGPDRGLVGLKGIKTKRPHDFAFVLDRFGNITTDGVVQEGRPEGENLPRSKFVVFAYGDDFGNPYGRSDLEAVYRAWWTSDNAYKWLAMLLERYGIPPTIALYDPNQLMPDQLAALKNVLKNLRSATAGTIPRTSKDSFELWSPELAGQVSSVFVPALQHLKQDIARGMLMPGLLGITPDSMGSYARAKVIFDVFLLAAKFIQSCIEDSVMHEQVIKPLVDLNFTTDEYPRFRFKSLTETGQGEMMKTWAALLDVKAVTPGPDDEAHIRGLMEFPDGADPTEVKEGLSPADITPELIESGVLTVNEMRQAYGLPPLPDGDRPVNAQIPGGLRNDKVRRGPGADRAPAGDPPPDQPQPDATPAEKAMAAEPGHEHPVDLTEVERRVDFAAVDRTITGVEDEMIGALATTIERQVGRMIERWIKAPPRLEQLSRVRFALPTEAGDTVTALLRRLFDHGRTDLRREVSAAVEMRDADPNFVPADAIAFLEIRAGTLIEKIHGQLTDTLREQLLWGLKAGLPFRETARRIRDLVAADWASTPYDTAARLETLVRTVTTEAYNQGRLVMARQPALKGLVTGMQYSAVLDSKTTPVCRQLHRKIFKIDDPSLDRLSPPNHYRCRSILAAVTLDVVTTPDQYVTRDEINEATKLADPKFGGAR